MPPTGRDHSTDIGEFEREISLGSDPQVKAYAMKYLPTLKHHLQMAHSLCSPSNGGGMMSDNKMPMPKTTPMAH